MKAGLPPAPAHLDAVGRAEYDRVAQIAGVTHGDMAIVSIYAAAWADVVRMEESIRGNEVTETPQGVVLNPALKALTIKKRELLQAAAKLGFTPADRARVPGQEQADEDPFAKFSE